MAVRCPNPQHMIEEIEFDLEVAFGGGDERRSQPARGHVQRHMPGMVEPRRERKPRLAHHLRPQLQGGAGVLPRRIGQLGPEFRHCRYPPTFIQNSPTQMCLGRNPRYYRNAWNGTTGWTFSAHITLASFNVIL